MQNPVPFVLRYPDADILTSSDHLANTVQVRHARVCACSDRAYVPSMRRMTDWRSFIWAWVPPT